MKDITVALELTVDESLTDAEIQQAVQRAMRDSLRGKRDQSELIDDILIDVKAITDGTFVDFTLPEWRVLEYNSSEED